MSINPLNDISRVYLEQVAVDEAKQSFPMKKVEKQMAKARAGSVYAKKGNPAVPNTTDAEKKNTTRFSKMFHASEKAKREKQEADKARRSPTFYKDTHPASAPKMAKAQREEFEIDESSHLEPDMKKRREANEKAIEDMKKTKAHKDMVSAVRKKFDEALDPVGQEDADIDNDGDTDSSDKYLHKRRKTIGKAIAKKKGMKEGFSNWRQDLSEVMDDTEAAKKIKEKKVSNKIKINPTLGEAVEEIGGTLLEMVEIDEFDFIVEGAYLELLDEGYSEDEIEDALEYALTEAKVTFGHDTASNSTEKKKSGLLDAARKKLAGAKTAAKAAVASGARKVARGALSVARKMEGGKGSPKTAERKPSTYRGAGAGTKEKVSSGSYTPPTKKKAEPASDPWEGSYKKSSEIKSAPKAKKAAAPKPAAPKAKAPAAAPKRKRKSKLDDLLASVRNEEIQLDEKALSIAQQRFMGMVYAAKKGEMPASAEVAKAAAGMSEKEAKKFAKTKHKGLPEKKVSEQAAPEEMSGKMDKKQGMMDRQRLANMKMLQMKTQQLERQKLQMKKAGKLPIETP